MAYDQLSKGRVSLPNHIYFITTVTTDRIPYFADLWSARLVIHEMRVLHENGAIESMAWVLMPDHLHWLFQLGERITLSKVLQQLKGRSSCTINQFLDRKGAIWQRGYYDHALRRDEDLITTARYIIANPIRAGLVRSCREYPFWDAKWL